MVSSSFWASVPLMEPPFPCRSSSFMSTMVTLGKARSLNLRLSVYR